MSTMTTKMGLISAVAVVAAALAADTASAQETVRGEILVVLAKEEAGKIDPALADESALKRPPFNSFRTMKVLGRPKLRLTPSKPSETKLPNDRRVRVVLERVLPDGRFQVKVSINRPGKNDYLPLLTVVASPGDPFFVAGQSYKGGKLIIGVRLGNEDDEKKADEE